MKYAPIQQGEPTEAQKIYPYLARVFPLDRWRGLDLGCGSWKIPGSIGIDQRLGVADILGDVTAGLAKLFRTWPKDTKFDYIFSSHLLEDFPETEQKRLLLDWLFFLRPGGLLILYVPEKGAYKGCNIAHQREFLPGDLERMFEELGLWKIEVAYESQTDPDGYGILAVAMKPV